MSFQNCKVIAAGVNPEEYHRTDVPRGNQNYPISSSTLGLIEPCPARFIRGFVSPESKAKDTGNLFDTLLLSASQFDSLYVEVPAEYPDKKTGELKPWNWNATYCKDWRESNSDKEPVKRAALDEARTAVAAVHADPDLAAMLAGATTQVMVAGEWKDRATGLVIPVKALLDIVPSINSEWKKYLYDYKTCRSASTSARKRETYLYGYARQSAFFMDLYVAATGEDRCVFCHIAQENVPPFHVEKDMLSAEFVAIGRRQYTFALSLYCHCLKTGEWSGYYAQDYIDGHRLIQPEPWMTIAGDWRILAAPATAAGEVADEESNEDVLP